MKVNLYPVDSINKSLNYYYSLNPDYAYKQTDPVWGLPFSLNEKNIYRVLHLHTKATIPAIHAKTAILFITGSGENNGTEMASGEGYQNDYGFKRFSCNFG